MEIKGFKKDWTTVDKLEYGTVFDYKGDLYMKVFSGSHANAVSLSGRRMNSFDESDKVYVVNGAFVVEE